MAKAVVLDVNENIATITMNRPEVLNAMNPAWVEDFSAAVKEVGSNDSVRAVIVTGAGRAFCAGGDLNHPSFSMDNYEDRRPSTELGYGIATMMRKMPKPVIAAVNGAAVGAGVSVAVACDLRVAGESSFFRLDFVKVGVMPDMGCTVKLAHIVGQSKAIEMAMLAKKVDAQEALRLSLVHEVVEDSEVMNAAQKMAGKLAAMPPLALRYIKRGTYELPQQPYDQAMQTESENINYLMGTEDCREGIAAFMEKRPPNYRGK